MGRKSWKSAEVTEKIIHELKVKFIYLCVCEREEKVNSFEITAMIFNVCKKYKSSILKGL